MCGNARARSEAKRKPQNKKIQKRCLYAMRAHTRETRRNAAIRVRVGERTWYEEGGTKQCAFEMISPFGFQVELRVLRATRLGPWLGRSRQDHWQCPFSFGAETRLRGTQCWRGNLWAVKRQLAIQAAISDLRCKQQISMPETEPPSGIECNPNVFGACAHSGLIYFMTDHGNKHDSWIFRQDVVLLIISMSFIFWVWCSIDLHQARE